MNFYFDPKYPADLMRSPGRSFIEKTRHRAGLVMDQPP